MIAKSQRARCVTFSTGIFKDSFAKGHGGKRFAEEAGERKGVFRGAVARSLQGNRRKSIKRRSA